MVCTNASNCVEAHDPFSTDYEEHRGYFDYFCYDIDDFKHIVERDMEGFCDNPTSFPLSPYLHSQASHKKEKKKKEATKETLKKDDGMLPITEGFWQRWEGNDSVQFKGQSTEGTSGGPA